MSMNRLLTASLALALGLATSSSAAEPPGDPTRPPTAAEIRAFLGQEPGPTETATQQWQLQSILIADQRRLAIINGRRVGVGDYIDAARVTAIAPGRVELHHRSERIVLTLASRRQSDHHE